MSDWTSLLNSSSLLPPLSEQDASSLARQLKQVTGLEAFRRSIASAHHALFFLAHDATAGSQSGQKQLGILYADRDPLLDGFSGAERGVQAGGKSMRLLSCPTTYANAIALHRALPFTGPQVLGLHTSAGCGDRLGLATPGHVRAIRKTQIAPIFAQQSIREMERSQRTPEDVMNDATWGVFQEGWRGGYGADADHLKDTPSIDACVAAGFTFYTFDPRDHVDDAAHSDDLAALRDKFAALPWDRLAGADGVPMDAARMRRAYLGSSVVQGAPEIQLREDRLLRAACKYASAMAYVAELYRHLVLKIGDRPFEVEVSVDETDTTTSPEEHLFVAGELKRLGVTFVSLAPRYVGRFEKGVDYIGDLTQFEAQVAQHAAIARACGPYKLSIHSGSDKFSIYPIVARLTRGLVHLKTAGTSYLEALRTIAVTDPQLFRDILDFAFEHYDEDKATYHVSADPALAPHGRDLGDRDLVTVLDNFHARQMLHVTFGSVLTSQDSQGRWLFRDRLFAALQSDPEAYYRAVEAHFDRHLQAFQQVLAGRDQ